jgi:hypothetical protein
MAGGPEPLGELDLDEPYDRHLVFAKSIIGRRRRHADRFADHRQELERDPRSNADLLERLGGKVGNPFEAGRVEEVERQGSALDGRGHVGKRDPGILERLGHLHAAHIARREAILVLEDQDAEIHQPNDVPGLHPGSLGCLLAIKGRWQRPTPFALGSPCARRRTPRSLPRYGSEA